MLNVSGRIVPEIDDVGVQHLEASSIVKVINGASYFLIGFLLLGAAISIPETMESFSPEYTDERLIIVWVGTQYESYDYSGDVRGIYIPEEMVNNTELVVENPFINLTYCDPQDWEGSCGWPGFVYFDPSGYEGQGLGIDNKVPFAIIETQLVNPEEDITFNSSEEEPFLIYAIGYVSETVESNHGPLSIYFCCAGIIVLLLSSAFTALFKRVTESSLILFNEAKQEMSNDRIPEEDNNTTEYIRFSLPQTTTVDIDGEVIFSDEANDLDKLRDIVAKAQGYWKINIHPEGSYLLYDAVKKTYALYKDGEIVSGMFDEQKGSTDDALAYLWTRTL